MGNTLLTKFSLLIYIEIENAGFFFFFLFLGKADKGIAFTGKFRFPAVNVLPI